jgi:pyruvate formate lyase activating enzyme
LARWWHMRGDGKLQCDLCPRECLLHEGQKGACFSRERLNDEMYLTRYGQSSGFCVDPIEKKPLFHFYPGSRVLSFGTTGCNLACKFCQNWNISKPRGTERLAAQTTPDSIAGMAARLEARSVAFTYNDPVIFSEFAMEVARACKEQNIHTVAVTAGYIHATPRQEFFADMDATNVDLKAFSEAFYSRLCGGHLAPVLDTLVWLRHASQTWLEITTLLIPGENDSPHEIEAMCQWIMRELGPDVPLHFTAFHPDYKLVDHSPTALTTLQAACHIGHASGLHYVYTGNLRDNEGGRTRCPNCKRTLIERDGYMITTYHLTPEAHCLWCGADIAGHFPKHETTFGNRRMTLHPMEPHP